MAAQEKSYLHARPGWGWESVPMPVIWGQASSIWGLLWTRIYMYSFSALGMQWRQGPLLLILSGSANRWFKCFGMNFPKPSLPELGLVLVVLASDGLFSQFLICLAMTSSRHCWRTLPACCAFHLTAQLVSSHVRPLVLKLLFTHLISWGLLHSIYMYICVYSNWRSPKVRPDLYLCCNRTAALGEKTMFPLAATDAGLLLGALKLSLCGFKAVAEKHYFKTSLILCANRALGLFCTDHSFGFGVFLVKVLTIHI